MENVENVLFAIYTNGFSFHILHFKNVENVANVSFMRVFGPSLHIFQFLNCGNFMIWPHCCHNMCQPVAATPISILETRRHLR